MDAILNWISKNPVLTVVIVLVLLIILIYNNLNAKKRRVEKSFSNIDVYLEKRFDEIESLLDQTMNSYKFEADTQTQVAGLRSGVSKAKNGSINDKVEASNQISAFIANPAIRTEAYPELDSIKEIGMFTARETANVENEISAARRQYNSNATSYNSLIRSFPSVIVAKVMGFSTPFELFKVSDGKKEPPVVKPYN